MPTLLLSIGVQIILFGVLAGVGPYLDVFLFVPRLHASSINLPASTTSPAWRRFFASFYGAFDEEILMRPFALTLLAWIGSRFSRMKGGRPTLAGRLSSTAWSGSPLVLCIGRLAWEALC